MRLLTRWLTLKILERHDRARLRTIRARQLDTLQARAAHIVGPRQAAIMRAIQECHDDMHSTDRWL